MRAKGGRGCLAAPLSDAGPVGGEERPLTPPRQGRCRLAPRLGRARRDSQPPEDTHTPPLLLRKNKNSAKLRSSHRQIAGRRRGAGAPKAGGLRGSGDRGSRKVARSERPSGDGYPSQGPETSLRQYYPGSRISENLELKK